MIEEYEILQSNSKHELIKAVKAFCEIGWKPQGGISVRQLPEGWKKSVVYYQAMIKEAP